MKISISWLRERAPTGTMIPWVGDGEGVLGAHLENYSKPTFPRLCCQYLNLKNISLIFPLAQIIQLEKHGWLKFPLPKIMEAWGGGWDAWNGKEYPPDNFQMTQVA